MHLPLDDALGLVHGIDQTLAALRELAFEKIGTQLKRDALELAALVGGVHLQATTEAEGGLVEAAAQQSQQLIERRQGARQ
ncbi:hypothetical protein D9M72_580190 [compost metagenome]